MQTVNFRCGHCGQLLAVGAQYLGMQVRCPHCQQVVVAPREQPAAAPPPAPAPAPPPASPPAPTMDLTFPIPPAPPAEEPESIFSAPAVTEDLFGQASAAKIEMPTENMNAPAPNIDLGFPAVPPPPPGESTLTFVERGQAQTQSPALAPAPVPPAPGPEPMPWDRGPTPEPVGGQGEQMDAATAAMLARPRSRSGWHIAIFIIPLISYAVLATIAAGILWWRMTKEQEQPHPLQFLPDLDGDHPLSKPKAPPRKTSRELPKQLIVGIGGTVDLGELSVTVKGITRGPLEIREGKNGAVEQMGGQALKLSLEFRNTSADMSFYPMDRYFTRFWIPGGERALDGLPRWGPPNEEPFTYLELGKEKFYGGPAGYRPPKEDKKYLDEYIVGQDFDEMLEPGQTLKTFVCTDPQNEKLQKALDRYNGEMLWRVQVRRGTVMVKGRRIPCTAVIGVKFTRDEITKDRDG